jgi:hypothetical protein
MYILESTNSEKLVEVLNHLVSLLNLPDTHTVEIIKVKASDPNTYWINLTSIYHCCENIDLRTYILSLIQSTLVLPDVYVKLVTNLETEGYHPSEI